MVRVVDHDVRFGVSTDEGDGDEWPAIRAKLLAADILVLATPIWLGQPSSVAKMVLERLDAELGETDGQGACSPTGRSPRSRSSGTRTVPTTRSPSACRR